MEKKRVLIVTQEMEPYLNLSSISKITSNLPKELQDHGLEIRVLMPKFGNINERRHRLHEVVRLSGININVNDEDYPLIIKVASLPGARLQVYFLDNEDFFKRKSVFTDDKGKVHADNADRTIFFCKGVLETVKKFGWAPDYIHCHGWMTSLIPLYLRTTFADEPVFQNAKIVYSLYKAAFEGDIGAGLSAKITINGMDDKDAKHYDTADTMGMSMAATEFADGVIVGSDDLDDKVKKFVSEMGNKPLMIYKEESSVEEYKEFYESLEEAN